MQDNDYEILNKQRLYWDGVYEDNKEMFGNAPSVSAVRAAELFKQSGVKTVLELGAGQGRDTLFFAQCGFTVYALEYSDNAIKAIKDEAKSLGLSERIITLKYDVRETLPFDNETFDACYSHMLFCMAITTKELEKICSEIGRVLKQGGVSIYTTRGTHDSHYTKGIHRGEDMYEMNGFIVHFLSKEKIEYLAKDFSKLEIDEFEEGELPRKLYYVVMRKIQKT